MLIDAIPRTLAVKRPRSVSVPHERSDRTDDAEGAMTNGESDSRWSQQTHFARGAVGLKAVPDESLALRMFPKVFPMGKKTAPGVISGGRFDW
jgi:hypothetical protein